MWVVWSRESQLVTVVADEGVCVCWFQFWFCFCFSRGLEGLVELKHTQKRPKMVAFVVCGRYDVSRLLHRHRCEMTARRCSRCGEEGHNARTCKAEYFWQPKRRSASLKSSSPCTTCGGSGVLPCRNCQSTVDGSSPTVQKLSSLSHSRQSQSRRSEVCRRCGGSSLIVCPTCIGLQAMNPTK